MTLLYKNEHISCTNYAEEFNKVFTLMEIPEGHTVERRFLNTTFLVNSGKLLFVPYTKDFGRITQFWGNDLATVLYATFCSDMLSSHSFSKQR